MKRVELFALLRKQAERLAADIPEIDVNRSPVDLIPGTPEYINLFMARYNYAAFQELMYSNRCIDNQEIPNDMIENFSNHLDAYLDKYAPNDPILKNYIRTISLYLTFIVEEPLHPPDMMMPGIRKGISRNGKFFCGGDKTGGNREISLCDFCAASLSRLSDPRLPSLKERD